MDDFVPDRPNKKGVFVDDFVPDPSQVTATRIESDPVKMMINAAFGTWGAATTKNLSNAPVYDPLAQLARAGQFANKGNQQLADLMAEKSGQLGAKMENAGIPGASAVKYGGVGAAGALGTASEALLPQNRLGVGLSALGPLMEAYQSVFGGAQAAAKPGMFAQLASARSKVPAKDFQQAINDPSVFNAPSVAEANAAYGKVAPGQGVARSLSDKLDKTILSEGDYTEAINRAGRMLKGTEMDASGNKVPLTPQDALDGVQAINRYLKNKAFTTKLEPQQMAEIGELKSGLMDWMESNGSPGLRDAASVVRKAHVQENLGRILPQNKFGGNDVLQTSQAGTLGAAGAATALSGHPVIAAPLLIQALSASPAFWAGIIRNYQAAANPQTANMLSAALVGNMNRP